MPIALTDLKEKLANPGLFMFPKVLNAHLENYFPSLVVLHGETGAGKFKQIHLFIPESETRYSVPKSLPRSRTFCIMFGLAKSPVFNLLKQKFLDLAKVVIDQDSDILSKIYPNTPQKIKLNNEVGMDWVRRNFDNYPQVVEPNLSRS